jgi:hypothetical protein
MGYKPLSGKYPDRQSFHGLLMTRHADRRVDTAKADADTPQPSTGNNLFAQTLITGGETEHTTSTISNPFVNIPV